MMVFLWSQEFGKLQSSSIYEEKKKKRIGEWWRYCVEKIAKLFHTRRRRRRRRRRLLEELQASYMWKDCRFIENVESFCPLCSTTTTTKLDFITAEYKKLTSSRELARTAFCTFKYPHARARSIDIVVCDLLLWTLLSWPSVNWMEVLSPVPTRARKKKCYFASSSSGSKEAGRSL